MRDVMMMTMTDERFVELNHNILPLHWYATRPRWFNGCEPFVKKSGEIYEYR